ncbi:hypothetical protein ACP70R_015685 [Stipagrostis hirtigluma subsp. patula]
MPAAVVLRPRALDAPPPSSLGPVDGKGGCPALVSAEAAVGNAFS